MSTLGGCPFEGNDYPDRNTTGTQVKGAWHEAKLNFARDMSYGDYLGLDQLLSAQHPLSPDHNEMLFIVQHQTSELWMKLVLHELRAALPEMHVQNLPPVFKMLTRVSRIMEQLVQSWNVLATMTPPEYSAIRPYLGASSGFQSYQYREIEFILGNKYETLLRPHAHHPERLAAVQRAFAAPSIYDEAVRLLAMHGLPVSTERLERDPHLVTVYDASVEAAWLEVYRNPQKYWEFYELGEKLVDLEDAFRQWRFRHLTTVDRIIGFKRGTGGTEGIGYLRRMLDVVLFPELWKLRTDL